MNLIISVWANSIALTIGTIATFPNSFLTFSNSVPEQVTDGDAFVRSLPTPANQNRPNV